MVGWWIGFGALWLLRVFMLGYTWRFGGLLALPWMIVEGLSLMASVWNAMNAGRRDYSWGGWYIAVAYAFGAVLIAPGVGQSTHLSVGVAACGTLLSAWGLWALAGRFTCGGSSWVSLCDIGPYRWIRHPQLLARVLIVAAVLFRSEITIGDLGRVLLAWLLTYSVLAVEERFLRTVPAWVHYKERVRWALIPGVA